MFRDSLLSAPVHVQPNFWQGPERPDNIMPGLRQITVPVPAGTRLEQVLGGPHSRWLWLRYGLCPDPSGIPPPGNLRAFRYVGSGEPLLVEAEGMGLCDASILDSCLRRCKTSAVEQLLVVDSEGRCRLWDPAKNRFVGELPLKQLPLRSAFSADGELLAMGFPDGRVSIWAVCGGGDTVSFELVNSATVGKVREAKRWDLSFGASGQVLYVVKIAQKTHLAACLGLNDQQAELFYPAVPQDWVTCLATNRGDLNEVCFSGLSRYCYHHSDGQMAKEPIAVAPESVSFVQSLQFVSSVQATRVNQPPIMRPRGLVIACTQQAVWLTDLTQSNHSPKILAEATLSDPQARFHRVGLDGNTLFAIVVRQQG